MKCELCGQEVESVGRTTKHYEGRERLSAIDEAIEVVNKINEDVIESMAVCCTRRRIVEALEALKKG
jgi:hypothetical protein